MTGKNGLVPDDALEQIVAKQGQITLPYDGLMPRRIRTILLVASRYDSFTFEEDGKLSETLFSDYLELNLRYAPRIDQVPTAKKALERLRSENYDLVISMLRVGDINIQDFGRAVRKLHPSLPVVLLTFSSRELAVLQSEGNLLGIERVFMWSGDVRLFLAIIKYVEDRLNAWHDARSAAIQCMILVEDSVQFYSSFLPILYTQIMVQTRSLLGDGLNRMERLLRMHARPKVLLATNYEEAVALYNQYQDHLLGTIVDAGFPRGGTLDPHAGHDFARMVKRERPDCAVLLQSSDPSNDEFAHSIGAGFINKRSPRLLHDLREFMQSQLGFGDFVFNRSDGSVVTTAQDLRGLADALKIIPEDSLLHHGRRKDFSTWLMARTEFALAKAIRSKRLTEFDSPADFRQHLLDTLRQHRNRSRAGIVSEFSDHTFEAGAGVVRIGEGSLGGKGRGLAFFNSLLRDYRIEDHVEGIRFFVPPTAVLATGVFDRYLESGKLTSLVLGDSTDEEITKAFLAARLPEDVREALRVFLGRVRYPLAVRSSSLLEDASYQPFAGIYSTFMIPNNQDSTDDRLNALTRAVKLVYASTFYAEARSYIESTPNRLEEEKMAVVIQQVVGRRHENYRYPDVAGVARSHNFYPIGEMKPQDGVVCAVLGLGRPVVEGGRCIRFSPADPTAIFEIMTPRDIMSTAQREFVALDVGHGQERPEQQEPFPNLVTLELEHAAQHGTLAPVCSVYSPRDGQIHDGCDVQGVKLGTLAGLLRDDSVPLGKALRFLLRLGQASLSWPVEIEFALNLRDGADEPHDLGFLQIRPMVAAAAIEEVGRVAPAEAICISNQALGHGQIEFVRDLIYVRAEGFNRALTEEIAEELGPINERLRATDRRYVLVGPGRWGSLDWRLGVPVTWGQISNVCCLVETDLADLRVSPSQGSHFFHNVTSFGVTCLTVNLDEGEGMLDSAWLDEQPAVFETDHVRHVRFEQPIEVVVDGHTGRGAVLKPGCTARRRA
jgi:hypothetical protein